MPIKKMLILSALILSLGCGALWAESTFPAQEPVPGGIALIPIPKSVSGNTAMPEVHYRNNRVMVLRSDNDSNPWIAAVGIPLSTQPGEHQIQVANTRISFEVVDKAYKEQRITLKNKRQVNPLQQDLERIRREKKEMVTAFKEWHKSQPTFTRFDLPVKGLISSPFGLKRFFNDQPRNPHSGLDIAAPEGTPILAPADGLISASGNYFFNGNTILMNHNNGLVSMYCHMQSISIKLGDFVKKGTQIGTVGKTGRATGPHLHWSVSLNNARIDPNLLLNR